jgi:hypothetical protein
MKSLPLSSYLSVILYGGVTGFGTLKIHLCRVKHIMHENTVNHTLYIVAYIMYRNYMRKVTSCLSAWVAVHKSNI